VAEPMPLMPSVISAILSRCRFMSPASKGWSAGNQVGLSLGAPPLPSSAPGAVPHADSAKPGADQPNLGHDLIQLVPGSSSRFGVEHAEPVPADRAAAD
jgi:hypothetical protein